jgi:hypothetical protein
MVLELKKGSVKDDMPIFIFIHAYAICILCSIQHSNNNNVEESDRKSIFEIWQFPSHSAPIQMKAKQNPEESLYFSNYHHPAH